MRSTPRRADASDRTGPKTLPHVKDTQYDIQNTDRLGHPESQSLKRWLCFYTNVLKFTTPIPTYKKSTKKTKVYVWARSAPVQQDKETTSETAGLFICNYFPNPPAVGKQRSCLE